MSKLWELSKQIDEIINHKGLDREMTRGKIGMAAGILMNITETTPDNDAKILKLKMAVNDVLGVTITE